MCDLPLRGLLVWGPLPARWCELQQHVVQTSTGPPPAAARRLPLPSAGLRWRCRGSTHRAAPARAAACASAGLHRVGTGGGRHARRPRRAADRRGRIITGGLRANGGRRLRLRSGAARPAICGGRTFRPSLLRTTTSAAAMLNAAASSSSSSSAGPSHAATLDWAVPPSHFLAQQGAFKPRSEASPPPLPAHALPLAELAQALPAGMPAAALLGPTPLRAAPADGAMPDTSTVSRAMATSAYTPGSRHTRSPQPTSTSTCSAAFCRPRRRCAASAASTRRGRSSSTPPNACRSCRAPVAPPSMPRSAEPPARGAAASAR